MDHYKCDACGHMKTIFLQGMDKCYECTSEAEIAERVKPPLTHWFGGEQVVDPADKVAVLKACYMQMKADKLRKKRR